MYNLHEEHARVTLIDKAVKGTLDQCKTNQLTMSERHRHIQSVENLL